MSRSFRDAAEHDLRLIVRTVDGSEDVVGSGYADLFHAALEAFQLADKLSKSVDRLSEHLIEVIIADGSTEELCLRVRPGEQL
jgi:hypothetical protein